MIDGLRKKNAPNLELLPEGRGFLLVEFGIGRRGRNGIVGATARRSARSARRIRRLMRIYYSRAKQSVWKIRESGVRSAAAAPGSLPEWEGWDDSAVAPEKVGAYLRDIRKLLDEYSYHTAFYGHFGHGCIHMRISFDLESETGIRKYARIRRSRRRPGGRATAARFPASMATGNRAARCCPRCSGRS